MNGRLQSGIEVTPVSVKKGIADIVQQIDKYRTVGFILTLYAGNNPENLEIRPTARGYQLVCMDENSIEVTYNKTGREKIFYDWKGKKRSKPKHLQNDRCSIALDKLADVLNFRSMSES